MLGEQWNGRNKQLSLLSYEFQREGGTQQYFQDSREPPESKQPNTNGLSEMESMLSMNNSCHDSAQQQLKKKKKHKQQISLFDPTLGLKRGKPEPLRLKQKIFVDEGKLMQGRLFDSNSENSQKGSMINCDQNNKITDYLSKEKEHPRMIKQDTRQLAHKIIDYLDSKSDRPREVFRKESEQTAQDNKRQSDKDRQTIQELQAMLEVQNTQIGVLNTQIDDLQANQIYKDQKIRKQAKYIEKAEELIRQQVIRIEYFEREQEKRDIQYQQNRLGIPKEVFEGNRCVEVWQDGQEIEQLQARLVQVRHLKEECQKGQQKPNQKGLFGSRSQHSNSQQDTINENKHRLKNIQRAKALAVEEGQLQAQLDQLEEAKQELRNRIKRHQLESRSMFRGQAELPLLKERYQLLSMVGKGGFGEVFKAFDLKELQVVACKITSLNRQWSMEAMRNFERHLQRENSTHIKLNHPHIVKLHSFFAIKEESSWCAVLEYCDGLDLGRYLESRKVLPEKEAQNIMSQILQGVQYLHSHSSRIIHYDLKPQNILYHQGLFKICDLGISKVMEENQTRMELTSQGNGTFSYLPPECFDLSKQPEISTKVDIWSLGVILYQMVLGKKPFGDDHAHFPLRAGTLEFPFKAALTSELKDCLKKCLTLHPKDRWDVEQVMASKFIGLPKK